MLTPTLAHPIIRLSAAHVHWPNPFIRFYESVGRIRFVV